MKTIHVTIPKNGITTGDNAVNVEATGYTGADCQAATAAIEKAIGNPMEEKLKPEFHSLPDVTTRTHA